jgi:Xaa-Pro aminopeptidase
MNKRLNKLICRIIQERLDALLVWLPANISYLTQIKSRDAYLLVSAEKIIYFTDSRYIDEVRIKLAKVIQAQQIQGSFLEDIARACQRLGLVRVGFEERHLSYAEFAKLKKYLGKSSRLISTSGFVEDLRRIKEPEEVRLIRQATGIAILALRYAKKLLRPGATEIKVAAELERYLVANGASGAAFDIIVASGSNSAFAHHTPGSRKIKGNEPVLIDIGAELDGYKSDLTRVFFLGKINPLVPKIYEIVAQAQKIAKEAIKPKVKIAQIDRISRAYITQAGYGEYFNHNLGHGIGLEVHEEPSIGRANPGVFWRVRFLLLSRRYTCPESSA